MSRRKVKAAPAVYDPQTGLIPRALCLEHPEAILAAAGVCRRIVRAWGTDYRGRIYLAASQRWDEFNRAVCNSEPYLSALKRLGYGRRSPLPFLAVVGSVEFVACEPHPGNIEDIEYDDAKSYRIYHGTQFGNRYIWSFENPMICRARVPVDPKQMAPGLFRIDAALAASASACAERPVDSPEIVAFGTVLDAGKRILQARLVRHAEC